jgi:hypothetical protein
LDFKGAFFFTAVWGILCLAVMMLLSARFYVPEVFTGLIGAVLIGLALFASARHNRRESTAEQEPVRPDGSRLDI